MTKTAMSSNPSRGLSASFIRNMGEWFLALFLLGGYFKADLRLAFIQSHIDMTMLFLVLSCLVFVYRAVRNNFALQFPRSSIWMAALFLLLDACLIGGLLYTKGMQYGFDKAMRFTFLTGWAFFGAILLITNLPSLRRFSWALVTISTALAIDALMGYPGGGQVGFVTALGSNQIALARASGIGLLAIVAFLLPAEKKLWIRLGLFVMAALLLWATLIAGVRGPVLALVVSFILFFGLSMHGFVHLKIDRFAFKLGIVALFVAIVLAFLGPELFPTLALRTNILLTDVGTSASIRLSLFQSAFDQWAASPILGGGTGQFSVALTGEDIRLYPHNLILELGAENGLVGVLAFIIMIAASFANGVTKLYAKNGSLRIVSRYLLISCCFAFLNAMVSGDINDNRMLFFFVGLLAVAGQFSEEKPIKMMKSVTNQPQSGNGHLGD